MHRGLQRAHGFYGFQRFTRLTEGSRTIIIYRKLYGNLDDKAYRDRSSLEGFTGSSVVKKICKGFIAFVAGMSTVNKLSGRFSEGL